MEQGEQKGEGKPGQESSALGIEIMDFEKQTAALAAERPMWGVRRAAGVGHGTEGFSSHGHISRDLEDFFPVIMCKRLGGESPWLETKQAGAGPSFGFFIQVTCDDFLFDP